MWAGTTAPGMVAGEEGGTQGWVERMDRRAKVWWHLYGQTRHMRPEMQSVQEPRQRMEWALVAGC
jgi:hypothetical protein